LPVAEFYRAAGPSRAVMSCDQRTCAAQEQRIDLGPLTLDVLHADRMLDGLVDRGLCRVLVAAVGEGLLPALAVLHLTEADLPYQAVGSGSLGGATLLISSS